MNPPSAWAKRRGRSPASTPVAVPLTPHGEQMARELVPALARKPFSMVLTSPRVRLSKLKKADLAGEAERLASGTGWLPAMLCTTTIEVESATRASPHASTGDTASGLDEDR